MKKVIVFGATGRIGKKLVKQLLDKGHHVTAFVRDPRKLEIASDRLETYKGDVLDAEAVAESIRGQDAVFSALGAGLKGNLRSEGTKTIVEGMKRAGVRRLISLSTLGAGDSYGNLNFYWKYVMFGILLRKAFADHKRQEQIIMESSLDWTLVRPGAFTDGELTEEYRHGFGPDARDLKLKISIADVADFMSRQFSDPTYSRQAVALSY